MQSNRFSLIGSAEENRRHIATRYDVRADGSVWLRNANPPKRLYGKKWADGSHTIPLTVDGVQRNLSLALLVALFHLPPPPTGSTQVATIDGDRSNLAAANLKWKIRKRRRGGQGRIIKHGMTGTPEHRAWASMRRRCNNPSDPAYPYYGGRGITVHPDWAENFQPFFKAVGRRPGPAYSLDRIDNDGNYEPGNVRWATVHQQVANRRTSVVVTLNGTDVSLNDACRIAGVSRVTAAARLRTGWPLSTVVPGATAITRRSMSIDGGLRALTEIPHTYVAGLSAGLIM